MIQKEWHSHRKFFILFITGVILICSTAIQAQAVLGARELGMGQAVTALQGSAWSAFANPAMVPGEAAVSFFGVRYFDFAEISDMAASIIYPTKHGILVAGVHRYGFDLFNESRLRIGYKNVAAGFHYGAVVNYSHVVQGGGYGSAGALGVDAGVAAPIGRNVWMGAKATNLNQPTYGSRNDERLARNLSVGLSYHLNGIAVFTTDVVKDTDFPLSYRGGLEVQIMGPLTGRAGITTAPQTFAGGFGYRSTSWGANVAVHRHENRVLGYSPAVDFTIYW